MQIIPVRPVSQSQLRSRFMMSALPFFLLVAACAPKDQKVDDPKSEAPVCSPFYAVALDSLIDTEEELSRISSTLLTADAALAAPKWNALVEKREQTCKELATTRDAGTTCRTVRKSQAVLVQEEIVTEKCGQKIPLLPVSAPVAPALPNLPTTSPRTLATPTAEAYVTLACDSLPKPGEQTDCLAKYSDLHVADIDFWSSCDAFTDPKQKLACWDAHKNLKVQNERLGILCSQFTEAGDQLSCFEKATAPSETDIKIFAACLSLNPLGLKYQCALQTAGYKLNNFDDVGRCMNSSDPSDQQIDCLIRHSVKMPNRTSN